MVSYQILWFGKNHVDHISISKQREVDGRSANKHFPINSMLVRTPLFNLHLWHCIFVSHSFIHFYAHKSFFSFRQVIELQLDIIMNSFGKKQMSFMRHNSKLQKRSYFFFKKNKNWWCLECLWAWRLHWHDRIWLETLSISLMRVLFHTLVNMCVLSLSNIFLSPHELGSLYSMENMHF